MKRPRQPKRTLRVHKRGQQPFEILVNKLVDGLKYPEMVFSRQLPVPKEEVKLPAGQIRVLQRVSGIASDYKIIAGGDVC